MTDPTFPTVAEVDASDPLSLAWYVLALYDRPRDPSQPRAFYAGQRSAYARVLKAVIGQDDDGPLVRERVVLKLFRAGIEPV